MVLLLLVACLFVYFILHKFSTFFYLSLPLCARLRHQLTKSGENTVTLRSVSRIISGKYQCEVSADAPFFHTGNGEAEMSVAELPVHNPVLTVYSMPNNSKNVIAIGELLKANCVSAPSFPPVNFTWTINNNIYPVRVKLSTPFYWCGVCVCERIIQHIYVHSPYHLNGIRIFS